MSFMSNDDLVNRIHEWAQGEHDAESSLAVAQLQAWRDAAYRLLSEIRANLPAITVGSERMLKPLFIMHEHEAGKGRKQRRVTETEPTAGWELRTWNDEGGPYHSRRDGCDFLLHDGQLLRAVKKGGFSATTFPGHVLPDTAFLRMLPQEENTRSPSSRRAVEAIGLLFTRAGLAEPQLPPVPRYNGQSFKHLTKDEWDQLRSQEIP